MEDSNTLQVLALTAKLIVRDHDATLPQVLVLAVIALVSKSCAGLKPEDLTTIKTLLAV